jgi:hypothetical protein
VDALLDDKAEPVPLATKMAAVTNGNAGTWTTVDISGIVPAGTRAVLLRYRLIHTATYYLPNLYLRTSNTDGAVQDILPHDPANAYDDQTGQVLICLTSDRKFDYYKTGTGNVDIDVVGYM